MHEQHTLELTARQFQYLNDMAKKHHLPDASKALRCLVNYAMTETAKEQEIFQTIRCADC